VAEYDKLQSVIGFLQDECCIDGVDLGVSLDNHKKLN
jgi:hypothetical protein